MNPPAPETLARSFLLLLTILIASLSALPYAGSWNDGSRLATVESLVDHGTWQIDDSIFVQTPRRAELPGLSPYAPNDPELVRHGTRDKLFIDGHYYSDKSPVPALAMAGVYQLLQWSTGLTAAKTPGWFCYWMTLLFSGTAFVVSALCIDLAALRSGLPRGTRLLVTYSFVFATMALPYARHVNNHILLLAVFALMLMALPRDAAVSVRRLMAVGTLAGIGYSIDLGVGPVLVLCTAGYLFLRTRSARALAGMLLCALPWFLAHHGLNYRIGGTFEPANAAPEYFAWPGSPFTERNLTGGWAHRDAAHFAAYAAGLLFGARGFLNHNLTLYLALPATVALLRSRTGNAPLLPFAASVIVGTWLLYAAASNNYSGVCCSVRWFVPLLAPFYYLIIEGLRRFPSSRFDLALLSVWALCLSIPMWKSGPWMRDAVPGYWLIVGGALVSWLGWRILVAVTGADRRTRSG